MPVCAGTLTRRTDALNPFSLPRAVFMAPKTVSTACSAFVGSRVLFTTAFTMSSLITRASRRLKANYARHQLRVVKLTRSVKMRAHGFLRSDVCKARSLIRQMALEHKMIEPLKPQSAKASSVTASPATATIFASPRFPHLHERKLHHRRPKHLTALTLRNSKGRVPDSTNSFALGRSVEYFRHSAKLLTICSENHLCPLRDHRKRHAVEPE